MATKKVDNVNGYVTYENQKLTKAGVYPYLGREISPDLSPDDTYYVLRPADEIKKSVNTFSELPLSIDHEMLGPHYKGNNEIHGTTDNVYFDESDNWLKGDVKVFTSHAINAIDNGVDELSLGYGVRFTEEAGEFEGESYTHKMTNLVGNHLALVELSRTDIKVMDKFVMDKFSIDRAHSMNEKEDIKDNEDEDRVEDKLTAIQKSLDSLTKIVHDMKETDDEDKKAEDTSEKSEDEEEKAEDNTAFKEDEIEKKIEDALSNALDRILKTKLGSAMDSFEKNALQRSQKRDYLAQQISKHVGDFDYSSMTINDVAKYGVEKLKVACDSNPIDAINAALSVMDNKQDKAPVTNRVNKIFGVK